MIGLSLLTVRASRLGRRLRSAMPAKAKLRSRLVLALALRAWRCARGLRRQLIDELGSLQLSLRVDIELRVARHRQRLETVVRRFDQILRPLQQLARLFVIRRQRQRTPQRLARAQRITTLEQHLAKIAICRLHVGLGLDRRQQRGLRTDQIALQQVRAALQKQQRCILAILRPGETDHAARVRVAARVDQILHQSISVFGVGLRSKAQETRVQAVLAVHGRRVPHFRIVQRTYPPELIENSAQSGLKTEHAEA
jgi:hypothetical protein